MPVYVRLRKIDWRKGGGELIGFALVVPLVMLIFCAIIMAGQLGLARQSIEYSTYSACRAAVICETQDQAQTAAELIIDDMVNTLPGVQPGSISVTLDNLTGSVWQKGELVKCSVSVEVDTITPWTSSVITSDVTMMVERPSIATP